MGASHVTIELPEDNNHSLKLGELAKRNGIKVAYHGHEQQHAKWWDTALEQSSHNAMNLDLGHYIAAGNTDAIELIEKQHPNILSMHVKDRQNPKNGKKNMPFGQGDTPIIDVLQMMRMSTHWNVDVHSLERAFPLSRFETKYIKGFNEKLIEMERWR